MERNTTDRPVAGVIFAAGKGSRMVGYSGNKTLLPLVPGEESIYEGEHPLLREVMRSLPPGPRGIVVNHCADEVRRATGGTGARYCHQKQTNGTGGALLAARPFLESVAEDVVVITMGDVPLILPSTYDKLVSKLDTHDLVVLAFVPEDRAQYGMLEMDGERVLRIVEWKYWRDFEPGRLASLSYGNAGVYAARRARLMEAMEKLAARPHHVQKQRGDSWVTIEEYFLTDLVELMVSERLSVGVVLAPREEITGVDTPDSLRRAQSQYAMRQRAIGAHHAEARG